MIFASLRTVTLILAMTACTSAMVAQGDGNPTLPDSTLPDPTIVNPPDPLPIPSFNPLDPLSPSNPSNPPQRVPPSTDRIDPNYSQVIDRTQAMVNDDQAQALVQQFGLSLVDLTWEDTARYQNSSVGPNISDLTIQVQQFNPEFQDYTLHLMPVIRYPNFSDRSADIPMANLSLLVGNEKGDSLTPVPLAEILDNLRDYLRNPQSWSGSDVSLLAERDSHVLVSAQACFLPIPAGGTAEFNPVLFNYQSSPGHPAVLTLMATREGTSITVIDNSRDQFEAGPTWGQRLFFNRDGERASLTAQRLRDFLATQSGDGTVPDADTIAAAQDQGLELVLIVQVPLKQHYAPTRGLTFGAPPAAPAPEAFALQKNEASDVESAVIGHGAVEGPFTEIDNLTIERDPNFPIRITVQFYKGTSNGVISRGDVDTIRNQIDRVYEDADYVGSLVTEDNTGRPTEYNGPKQEPETWWQEFLQRSNVILNPRP